MKIIRSLKEVTEGWYLALIVAIVMKSTRRGELQFLRCRIISGEDSVRGREIDFLVPQVVDEGSHFYRFLVSAYGAVKDEVDVDLQALVNRAVAIRVKKVRRKKQEYLNVVAIAPPEQIDKAATER